MNRSTRHLAIAIVAALAMGACGGDDDAAETADTADTADTEETAEDATTAPAADTAEATADETADAEEPAEQTADEPAGAFPVTIEHKYGETTVPAEPQRVVSIGFAEHDGLLALGVVPVGVRDWYGEQPFATWPWAQDELGDAEPEVLAAAELNFEQIAALDPDLILGVSSGMSDTDYATLSAIAPTIAQPGEFPDYGTPWREQLQIAGAAVGKADLAEQIIADTEQLFADARAAHPEFAGQTVAVSFTFENSPGAYASNDIRSQVLTELGFVVPPEFDELAGDSFYFSISDEELATLDHDVIVWIVGSEAGYAELEAMPLRPTLNAYQEGREVIADPLLSGAFSHSSPLSLEYVIEELVPELALAVDGDPDTVVPSLELLDGGSTEGDGSEAFTDEEQAAADAWATVFDSTIGFDDKAMHLADAEALADTVDGYTTAGDAMGGISLVPTGVAIDGESATITYDVLFGDTAAYTGLTGTIELVDGTWVVSRDEFCSFMASARNACPA